MGAVAGVCGQCSSYPLDIVRRRMQTAGIQNLVDSFYCKYRIRGNFRGLPIFAVFRGQYESVKIKIIFAVFQFSRYFVVSMNQRKLKSRNIFLFLSENRH